MYFLKEKKLISIYYLNWSHVSKGQTPRTVSCITQSHRSTVLLRKTLFCDVRRNQRNSPKLHFKQKVWFRSCCIRRNLLRIEYATISEVDFSIVSALRQLLDFQDKHSTCLKMVEGIFASLSTSHCLYRISTCSLIMCK